MTFQPSPTSKAFRNCTTNEPEVNNKTNPDLPLSQPKAKQYQINASTKVAKNRGMTTMDVKCPSKKKGKMAKKEMFGKRASYQKCSFVFHM